MSPIPQAITTALTKQQDRLYILHLEKDLIKFIKNSILGNIKQPEYVIQAQYLKNSYYRLLVHQLAGYLNLQHYNNQMGEIVVTPNPMIDYTEFFTQIENNQFVKVIDVASEYQIENNNNIPSVQIQKQDVVKPKLIKKLSKKSVKIPEKNQNENLESIDIEGQRASKEALYKSLREKIFTNEEEEEEEEEEGENIDPEENVLEFKNPIRYYYPAPPFIPQYQIPYPIMSPEAERRILNNYNPYIIIPDDINRPKKYNKNRKNKH